MKKRVFVVLILVLAIMGISKNVYAKENTYYTTPNGIELTREEYEFLTTFYWDGYPDIMTQAMYDKFIEEDLINSDVQIRTYTEPQLGTITSGTRSTSHSTNAKTIQISSGCQQSYCIISILNTWHASPTVKGWDNIGAYISGTNLISHEYTLVANTNGATYYNNLITATNGVGNSVALPNDDSIPVINMVIKVGRGGTVFGSYQHAMQSTTLLNSQNYNLDIIGYGNVFDYYGTAIGIYDGMNGVDITV